uniref:C3H1-type domain-containing protein n=1 Tax=Araucaria cunninghamii TaxID=56994 RepID=A0A0D6R3G6_ARACU
MDTTAAAELSAGGGLTGADAVKNNNNYWAPGAPDHAAAAWATHHDYDDNDDSRQPWTPDYRHHQHILRSNGGEAPLKKAKSAYNNNNPEQQAYDPFEPLVGNGNPSNSRSASGTTTAVEYGQGASSGTPPPPESAASSSGGKVNRATIGRMFFKTKLCCKFRAGTCPYLNNCNFAHGMEELRKPPPNWQEIVAQQEEDRRPDRRGDGHVIPTHGGGGGSGSAAVVVAGGNGGGNGGEARFHKSRFCKKYYTEEGCPYGDRCNFLHDDQGRSRESVAISLGPTTSNGSGGGNEIASAAANGGGGANGNSNGNNNGNNNSGNGAFQRPMYWKTRICNKWETTGHCPFGDKCHFAHGVAELQKYGGGLLESESGATSGGLRNDLKQSASSGKLQTDPGIGTSYSVFGTDNYSMGVPNQRSLNNFQGQRQGQRPLAKWKGPDKISQIYGDWIDESEWEYANLLTVPQPEEVNQIHEEESHDG